MVAGHLHEKNGYYYIILNLTDSAGKRKPKWISTGLTIKGNKKRAEQMLMEERRKYANAKAGDDVLFADFMEQWLEIVKSTVSLPTYSSYVNAVKSIIAPYFRKKKILLRDLQAHDIQMFYQEQLQRVKASSVIHYHANIHKALKYAVKNDMIPSNPADKVERPKQDKFYGNFYDRDELNKLFEAVAGTKLELPVLLGAFYGLRRSEIVGLKWSAIDFEQNTITISHTVSMCISSSTPCGFMKSRFCPTWTDQPTHGRAASTAAPTPLWNISRVKSWRCATGRGFTKSTS